MKEKKKFNSPPLRFQISIKKITQILLRSNKNKKLLNFNSNYPHKNLTNMKFIFKQKKLKEGKREERKRKVNLHVRVT